MDNPTVKLINKPTLQETIDANPQFAQAVENMNRAIAEEQARQALGYDVSDTDFVSSTNGPISLPGKNGEPAGQTKGGMFSQLKDNLRAKEEAKAELNRKIMGIVFTPRNMGLYAFVSIFLSSFIGAGGLFGTDKYGTPAFPALAVGLFGLFLIGSQVLLWVSWAVLFVLKTLDKNEEPRFTSHLRYISQLAKWFFIFITPPFLITLAWLVIWAIQTVK